jgi:hypothetical protein
MSSTANPVLEVLSGIYRFLPNTLTVSLMVLGIFLGKISWIMISSAVIVLCIVVLLIQAVFLPGSVHQISAFKMLSGGAALSACSPLPSRIKETDVLYTTPSLWMTVTSFYLAYILMNAINVYTANAAKPGTPDKYLSFKIDSRKSVGLISIIATFILLACLIITRFFSQCESTGGALLGIVLGLGAGVGMWYLLSINGTDIWPDIHGVLIGLKPGHPYSSENYYA